MTGRQIAMFILLAAALSSLRAQPPFDAQGRPNRSLPGPWNNDVLVFRVTDDGTAERLATFPRAGVPTVARLADGRLIAAHQHFPEDNDADFDKVAVHFSSDEGRTWTTPVVVSVAGLPEGMRFPFDPTLMPLPDGRVRLYFTGTIGRTGADPPAIHSAVSNDGVSYVYEPGARFGVEGRMVIDCAVALHRGVFHLFAPANGSGGSGARPGQGPPPRGGMAGDSLPGPPMRGQGLPATGYHAISADGLTFTRVDDVRMSGGRRWLGNVVSDGGLVRFFGTGGPGGIWTATSMDGARWELSFPVDVPGADPGAVRLRDGSWLVIATGPPSR